MPLTNLDNYILADKALALNLITWRQTDRVRHGHSVYLNDYGECDNERIRDIVETEEKMRKMVK